MTYWSEWKERIDSRATPYVDWEVDLLSKLGLSDKMVDVPIPSVNVERQLKTRERLESFSQDKTAEEQIGDSTFPVPQKSANPYFEFVAQRGPPAELQFGEGDLEGVNEDTVIVGVIDVDVGIGHRRFRTKDGRSRVLASWQQGADWSVDEDHRLPFGRQIADGKINESLSRHSNGDLHRNLDQQAFYTELGLLQFDRAEGIGDLAGTVAHGTHVLGLCAGADPYSDLDQDLRDNVKMLVVNLPHPSHYGEGGAFLDYYLTYGIRWILNSVSNIASLTGIKNPPLFINVSFGKQAGARDNSQTFVGELNRISQARNIGQNVPTVLVPAGNDNLERCHARFDIKKSETKLLQWRVQPDDGTSNFLEVWVERTFSAEEIDRFQGKPALLLDVVPPGGTPTKTVAPEYNPAYRDLIGGLGRIYVDWVAVRETSSRDHRTSREERNGVADSLELRGEDQQTAEDPQAPVFRLRYLVCLSPNAIDLKGYNVAPAGTYQVMLQHDLTTDLRVAAQIQTDEATLKTLRNAKRSYFEDKEYRTHEWEGRLADTYLYRSDALSKHNLDEGPSPIRRHGTMNSYASTKNVTAVAGYRLSDGRPANYSGTGLGKRLHSEDRAAPTIALPSDEGYAHFGILSDGAQDGSTVAMRGTSFACATATRFAVEDYLEFRPRDHDNFTASRSLQSKAVDDKDYAGWLNREADIEKVGRGRVIYGVNRLVERTNFVKKSGSE